MSSEQQSQAHDEGSLYRFMRWGLIGALLLSLAVLVKPAPPPLKPGTPAPGLNLKTLNGSPVDVSAYQGKPTLLNFFATWCQPCRAEIPDLNRLHKDLGGEVNVVGLLVFSGSLEESAPQVRSMGIQYPVWMTDDASAAHWEVSAVPATFLVDAKGTVRWSTNGAVNVDEVQEAIRQMNAPPAASANP